MAIGNTPTVAQLNGQAAQLATMFRTTAQQALYLQGYVTELGQAGLVSLGFSSGDATTLVTMAGYMNTLAGVYLGTVQQGGSGGTGATLFNFQSALVPLTGPS